MHNLFHFLHTHLFNSYIAVNHHRRFVSVHNSKIEKKLSKIHLIALKVAQYSCFESVRKDKIRILHRILLDVYLYIIFLVFITTYSNQKYK